MTTVAIETAQKELPELIRDVLQGEHVVITQDQKPVAELVPISTTTPKPTFGSARGQIRITGDFEAPLADFDPYTR